MTQFLIRHLLESTFFCLLMVFLMCFVRKSATTRCTIWLIGIVKFAIPSVLLATAGARLAFLWPATSWISWVVQKVSSALMMIANIFSSGVQAADGAAGRSVLFFWMLGVIAMLSIWMARLRNSYQAIGAATDEEQEALVRAKGRLRVGSPVRLRSSESTEAPALRGIWKTTLTIPRGMSERLTTGELEAVLLHELAHAKRLDNLTGVLVHCLVCMFWFHPLLWLLERRLHIEREQACDELVIACGTKPQTYAAGILKVCKFHLFEATAGVSSMAGSDLKRRLETILNGQCATPFSYFPRLLIVVLGLFMTMIPMAGGYCQQCVSNGSGVTTGADAPKAK